MTAVMRMDWAALAPSRRAGPRSGSVGLRGTASGEWRWSQVRTAAASIWAKRGGPQRSIWCRGRGDVPRSRGGAARPTTRRSRLGGRQVEQIHGPTGRPKILACDDAAYAVVHRSAQVTDAGPVQNGSRSILAGSLSPGPIRNPGPSVRAAAALAPQAGDSWRVRSRRRSAPETAGA